MCKRGDIILIDSYQAAERALPRHSFIVLDDTGGTISGFDFDFIALVMSSMKSNEQQRRKLSYAGNLPVGASEQEIDVPKGGNGRNSFVKCEQFYYFLKDKLSYSVIGRLSPGVLDIIVDYINELVDNGVEFEQIIDNLK